MSDEENATAREWTDLLRRIRFGATVTVPGSSRGVRGATLRAVALMLATYADADGSRIFPGTARLAVACEIDYRTAKRCLAALRWLGLIRVVRAARRRGLADEYRLTIPGDLLDKVDVLSPAQMDLEVERIRDGNRRRVDDEPGTGSADTRTAVSVRVPQTPVQAGPVDGCTGAGSTSNDGCTGASRTVVRVRPAPPTHHDVDTTTTHHTEVNLRTAVTVSRAREAVEDQIPEEGEGEPAPPPAPHGCPTHGRAFAAGTRPDGKPACPLCRATGRRPPAGDSRPGLAPVIPIRSA